MAYDPYNPLDKSNLGRSIAEALLLTSVTPLTDTGSLVGAGVYAIYYTGSYASYHLVAAKNVDGKFEQPIYVGKAIPKGARKGGMLFDSSKGHALRTRLKLHARSIGQFFTLDVNDFWFRSLVCGRRLDSLG